LSTGAGASKFLRVQRIFAQIFPKSCRATFADRFYGVTSKKMVFTCFSSNFGRHFCPNFQGFCLDTVFRDVVRIFRDIAHIFRDFARIFNKSELLWVRLHPHLLHHYFCHLHTFVTVSSERTTCKQISTSFSE